MACHFIRRYKISNTLEWWIKYQVLYSVLALSLALLLTLRRCCFSFPSLASQFLVSSREHVETKQKKNYPFTSLICLSANGKSGRNIYRIMFEWNICSALDTMYKWIRIISLSRSALNQTHAMNASTVEATVFSFSYNFRPFVGICYS